MANEQISLMITLGKVYHGIGYDNVNLFGLGGTAYPQHSRRQDDGQYKPISNHHYIYKYYQTSSFYCKWTL